MPAAPFAATVTASRISVLIVLSVAAMGVVGCGDRHLETGYQYTPLGSTPVQRRAYYAGPFSPEARAAMMSPEGAADTPQPRNAAGGPRGPR